MLPHESFAWCETETKQEQVQGVPHEQNYLFLVEVLRAPEIEMQFGSLSQPRAKIATNQSAFISCIDCEYGFSGDLPFLSPGVATLLRLPRRTPDYGLVHITFLPAPTAPPRLLLQNSVQRKVFLPVAGPNLLPAKVKTTNF